MSIKELKHLYIYKNIHLYIKINHVILYILTSKIIGSNLPIYAKASYCPACSKEILLGRIISQPCNNTNSRFYKMSGRQTYILGYNINKQNTYYNVVNQ